MKVPESLRDEKKPPEQASYPLKQKTKIEDDISEMTGFDGFLGTDYQQLMGKVSKLKERKLEKKDKNSVTCIYGQKGLLQFMSNMFSLLNE